MAWMLPGASSHGNQHATSVVEEATKSAPTNFDTLYPPGTTFISAAPHRDEAVLSNRDTAVRAERQRYQNPVEKAGEVAFDMTLNPVAAGEGLAETARSVRDISTGNGDADDYMNVAAALATMRMFSPKLRPHAKPLNVTHRFVTDATGKPVRPLKVDVEGLTDSFADILEQNELYYQVGGRDAAGRVDAAKLDALNAAREKNGKAKVTEADILLYPSMGQAEITGPLNVYRQFKAVKADAAAFAKYEAERALSEARPDQLKAANATVESATASVKTAAEAAIEARKAKDAGVPSGTADRKAKLAALDSDLRKAEANLASAKTAETSAKAAVDAIVSANDAFRNNYSKFINADRAFEEQFKPVVRAVYASFGDRVKNGTFFKSLGHFAGGTASFLDACLSFFTNYRFDKTKGSLNPVAPLARAATRLVAQAFPPGTEAANAVASAVPLAGPIANGVVLGALGLGSLALINRFRDKKKVGSDTPAVDEEKNKKEDAMHEADEAEKKAKDEAKKARQSQSRSRLRRLQRSGE